jgi:GH24 family phage-related lysozyme (muramidase)
MSKLYRDYNWAPLINFESGGRLYYEKNLKKVTWPGGASGLTIGIGADLGYMSKVEFKKYFAKYFDEKSSRKLIEVLGLKGDNAKSKLYQVSNIEMSWENAITAFTEWTLPKFWNLTNKIWPGVDLLCENAQIALVSLVFNRGSSLVGNSRKEMRNIIDLVKKKDYNGISMQIKSMKRLWANKNLDGLIKRRDIESNMVLSCVK